VGDLKSANQVYDRVSYLSCSCGTPLSASASCPSIYVHDTDTQSIYEYVGTSYRRLHNSLEHRGYNWLRHDLPAIDKELGFRHTWNLWKSSSVLLCHGRYQYHHRHNHDSITNALSLSAATRASKETPRNGHAKHRYDVSCSLSFTSLN
jgi:hypothetical protein